MTSVSAAGVRAADESGLGEEIGRRVAAYRLDRSMRVAGLARAVGVSPSLISQIERGQSRPSVATLFAIAQALRLPVDAFFREPDQDAPFRRRDPAGPSLRSAPARSAEPAVPAPSAAPVVSAPPVVPATSAPSAVPVVSAMPAPSALAEVTGLAGPDAPDEPGLPEPGLPEPELPHELSEPELPGPERADREHRYVVRDGERAAVDIEGGVRWERLTRRTLPYLDVFEAVYEPGARSHPVPYAPAQTEVLLVTGGTLDVTLGFDRYRLHEGDSVELPPGIPRRCVNPGVRAARAVTVVRYDCLTQAEEVRVPLPSDGRSR